jgi:hypothetical protein
MIKESFIAGQHGGPGEGEAAASHAAYLVAQARDAGDEEEAARIQAEHDRLTALAEEDRRLLAVEYEAYEARQEEEEARIERCNNIPWAANVEGWDDWINECPEGSAVVEEQIRAAAAAIHMDTVDDYIEGCLPYGTPERIACLRLGGAHTMANQEEAVQTGCIIDATGICDSQHCILDQSSPWLCDLQGDSQGDSQGETKTQIIISIILSISCSLTFGLFAMSMLIIFII